MVSFNYLGRKKFVNLWPKLTFRLYRKKIHRPIYSDSSCCVLTVGDKNCFKVSWNLLNSMGSMGVPTALPALPAGPGSRLHASDIPRPWSRPHPGMRGGACASAASQVSRGHSRPCAAQRPRPVLPLRPVLTAALPARAPSRAQASAARTRARGPQRSRPLLVTPEPPGSARRARGPPRRSPAVCRLAIPKPRRTVKNRKRKAVSPE